MTSAKINAYSDIAGWFAWDDRALFDALLAAEDDRPGVLIELGAYLGRSAVIIGDHVQAGERFIVVDLFGSEAGLGKTAEDEANRRENKFSYESLTRTEFERNYLALHPALPEIVQGLTTEIVHHVEPGTARFIHVDASHHYPQVAADIKNAQQLLRPDGVVVFDDFRAEHTPGVAGAVWEAVRCGGLVPFAITAHKLYGTWGDPEPHLATVRNLDAKDRRTTTDEHAVLGHTIVRLRGKPKPKPPATPSTPPPPAPLNDTQLEQLADKVAERLRASLQTPAHPRTREDRATTRIARWAKQRFPFLAG